MDLVDSVNPDESLQHLDFAEGTYEPHAGIQLFSCVTHQPVHWSPGFASDNKATPMHRHWAFLDIGKTPDD